MSGEVTSKSRLLRSTFHFGEKITNSKYYLRWAQGQSRLRTTVSIKHWSTPKQALAKFSHVIRLSVSFLCNVNPLDKY